MKKNLGSIDRTLRLLGAMAIIALYFTNQITGTAAIVLGIVAALLIGTSLTAHCPVYPLFGWSTRKKEQKAVTAH
jgi:hypothetical protein